MNFIELQAFSKVEPDWAKLIARTLKVRAGAQIRTPTLLLAVIHERPRRLSSQKSISRILHTLVLRGENWLSALVGHL
jgi:hypothetical protein